MLTVVAASVLELAGKPLGAKGIVSSMRPTRYYTVPRESLEMFFENLHDLTNFFVLEFQRVLFVENIFTTIAVCRSSSARNAIEIANSVRPLSLRSSATS